MDYQSDARSKKSQYETLGTASNLTHHIIRPRQGDALVVARSNLAMSHAGLARAVASLASHLEAFRGHVVSLAFTNTPENVICFLAACTVGTAAPLNTKYTRPEFEFFLEDVSSAILLLHRDGNTEAERACEALRIPVRRVVIERDASGEAAARLIGSSLHGLVPRTTSSEEPIAMLLHTSGTTSKPKCVPLSHDNLLSSVRNIVSHYELSGSDTTLLVMPLFHVHGLMSAFLSTIASGGTLILPPEGAFSAPHFWKMLRGTVRVGSRQCPRFGTQCCCSPRRTTRTLHSDSCARALLRLPPHCCYVSRNSLAHRFWRRTP